MFIFLSTTISKVSSVSSTKNKNQNSKHFANRTLRQLLSIILLFLITGMILLSELSRRRIRSINKLIRVGRTEPVVVIRVDKDKGYIDLSKRRVSPEDIERCTEVFSKGKVCENIQMPLTLTIPWMLFHIKQFLYIFISLSRQSTQYFDM